MSAILKFDFQRRKQLRFSEVNYLNYSKSPTFACDNYIFPRTRGNENKQCTHSTPVNYKLLTLAYKSKHATTPPYIQNLIKPHNYPDGNIFLRSHADDNLLVSK